MQKKTMRRKEDETVREGDIEELIEEEDQDEKYQNVVDERGREYQ